MNRKTGKTHELMRKIAGGDMETF